MGPPDFPGRYALHVSFRNREALDRGIHWLADGSERGDNQPPLTDDSGAPCMSVCYGPDTKPVCCKSSVKRPGKLAEL